MPTAQLLHLHGWKLLMTHIVGKPGKVARQEAALLQQQRPDIVVCGHSHVPLFEKADGTWFINPGSAGGLPHAAGTACCC
jgi:predicted phosphodiesterase